VPAGSNCGPTLPPCSTPSVPGSEGHAGSSHSGRTRHCVVCTSQGRTSKKYALFASEGPPASTGGFCEKHPFRSEKGVRKGDAAIFPVRNGEKSCVPFHGRLMALASRANPVPTKLRNSTIADSIATLMLRANQILYGSGEVPDLI
jgi:hypothetical protein